MAVGDAHVFPGFLIPVLAQLSLQSHGLLFSHASAAEVRGRKIAGKKVLLNFEFATLTTDLPGRGLMRSIDQDLDAI